MAEVMVVIGSARTAPLCLSTSTTFALTIRLRYVAAIIRFSSSTKLMTEFMRQATALAIDHKRNRTYLPYTGQPEIESGKFDLCFMARAHRHATIANKRKPIGGGGCGLVKAMLSRTKWPRAWWPRPFFIGHKNSRKEAQACER